MQGLLGSVRCFLPAGSFQALRGSIRRKLAALLFPVALAWFGCGGGSQNLTGCYVNGTYYPHGNAPNDQCVCPVIGPCSITFPVPAGIGAGASRRAQTITLLPHGQILLTGGRDATGAILDTAEIYDSLSRASSRLPAKMTSPRVGHTATRLLNGQVLLVGGKDSSGAVLNTAEVYDPASRTFTALTAQLATARVDHTAVLLSNGQIRVTGGADSSGAILAASEVYDPEASGLTPSASGLVLRAQSAAASSQVASTDSPGQAAVAAPAARSGASNEPSTPGGLKIILLKPSVRFEDIHTGRRVNGMNLPEPGGVDRRKKPLGPEDSYEQLLLAAAKTGVGPKATLLDEDALDPPAADACTKLEPLTSRLARGNVNDEAVSALANLAALDERYVVLVQFLRLETGPGSSWNMNTGAITSSTDSTLIQAALVSSKTGKVIWKNERLIRNKALKPTDSAWSKALAELYKDFDLK